MHSHRTDCARVTPCPGPLPSTAHMGTRPIVARHVRSVVPSARPRRMLAGQRRRSAAMTADGERRGPRSCSSILGAQSAARPRMSWIISSLTRATVACSAIKRTGKRSAIAATAARRRSVTAVSAIDAGEWFQILGKGAATGWVVSRAIPRKTALPKWGFQTCEAGSRISS